MTSYSQKRSNGQANGSNVGPDGIVLQKQLPSSQVPRYNPHGNQSPPKLRVPDRPNAYSPIKRQFGKAKTVREEEKVDFMKFNIEELLLTNGVEFRNPEKVQGGWLPLEAYDDREYDTRLPVNWLKKDGGAPRDGVGAQGLWKDKDGLCYWRKLRLLKYLPKSDRFEGYWENTKEKCRLSRIYILFDDEDPRIFARRFKQAYSNRLHADALIKYNYYIENMPKHQIPEVDNMQVNRILSMTQNTKSLRGKSSADTTTLLNEVNKEFAKTMNNIIFDKHLNEKGRDLITGPLSLPDKEEKGETPYFAMCLIPPHNFPKNFSKFCFRTLQIKDEVIRAQQEIRKECNDVAAKDIYNPNIPKTTKVDEFKQIQASSISQNSYYLKETWVNKIKEIIKANFQESPDQGAKSWFNLAETNKEAYEVGKLKKFLTQTKFIMQDTLLQMTQKSVKRYVDSILSFLPIGVKVVDTNNVTNTYFTADEIKAMGAPKPKFSLFHLEISLNKETNQPEFSHTPQEVVSSILKTFDNGLRALQEISQLEQKLLPNLFKSNQKMFLKVPVKPEFLPEKPELGNLKQLPDENTWVFEEYERLEKKIQETVAPVLEYLKTFDKYEKEYNLDTAKEISLFDDENDPPEPEQLRKEVIKHKQEEERLRKEIPEFIEVSYFKINCKEIRNTLANKHASIAAEQIELIAKMAKRMSNQTMEDFDKINLKIESTPKDIEELSTIKEFMENVPNEIEKLEREIKVNVSVYSILNEFQYKFADEEDYDKQWRLYGSPLETVSKISKQGNYLEKEKEKFVSHMKTDQAEFDTKFNEISNLVTSFSQYSDINNFEEVSTAAKGIFTRLQDAIEQAKVFNNRELLTGQEETAYDNINALAKEFQPFYELWTTTELWRNSHKSWLHDDFEKMDALFLEETVETADKTLGKVFRLFRDKELPQILKIAEIIKEEVTDFKPYVPMAVAMRTEGMKDRHWEAISNKVGFQVKPYEGFTFQHILDMDLYKFTEEIQDIGDRAGKEYTIECNMVKMKAAWEQVFFTLKPFKTSGTYTVIGFDDAQQVLDDHSILTQTMQFSPFKGPFLEDIDEWNNQLLYVSNVIEEWLRCQQAWMYLQPIFDSPDIMKQLPGESKRFKGVDKQWKDIINGTKQNPNVLKTCTRDNLTLHERFVKCNNELDKVQHGLTEYLEKKRSNFSRFYFLADGDLLQILSQTKEVENVRGHLKKVFENMADLNFQLDKTITAMMSGEGERIEFDSLVDPKDKPVEFWMGEVEQMMFTSVRSVLKHSITDYTKKDRNEWILEHPGQCVLNGSQVHWTSEIEEAIEKNTVAEYYKLLETQILETVKLVRQRLNKLQSITLGALIVIDVHGKDVVQALRDQKISSINEFEWIKQMRYYWEEDDCRVKCIQTDFPYGYEYLGNTQRLVITPLTDKCYMTLMGALKLNLGGAPAGPAGTGKTESTKDLAKALAKQCVVFNCSSDMEYSLLGRFFKGLAASGAWCCFDEFNRINIEVLSVIAQALQKLFAAKGERIPEMEFEDSIIQLKPTFCVFITMNPGYAGRTELPDNLKALFRPVAMMVPDYGLIGRIMLYSFGFNQAVTLANKMAQTFKLSSEQLSSQFHYDYGMRAVRSVINAAGILKRASPDMDEDQLLLRALKDVNVPKFLKDDIPLFNNIIKDLFPRVEQPAIDYGELLVEIKNSCKHYVIQPVDVFIEKIMQLYDTCQVRHGLMLVGPSGGGKTANYKTLARALSALAGQGDFKKVNYHILNPKSITMGQLYGELDTATQEWNDGVAAKIVADSAADPTTEKHWVMFDGPVDAIWIESMNTVLDDNKKLCLNSGQIIPLSDHMTMMFEVEDLQAASPATVSRCGMVYMEPGALGLTPLIKTYREMLPDPIRLLRPKHTVPLIDKLIAKYLEVLISFTRKHCPEPVITVNNNLCQSFMRVLDCYFNNYKDTELKTVTPDEIENLEHMMEPLIVFSLVWSVGCTTTIEGRTKFSNKLRELMGKENKHKFPAQGTVYDYQYDREEKVWVNWTQTIATFSIDMKTSYSEIIVPTFDSIRMQFIKKLLISNNKHILAPGPTGTGKTINIFNMLNSQMSEDFQTIPITFSAQTSARGTQEALDGKLEKRRKGVAGPPPGKKYIVFVDDLNMPKKEEYGAQPPLELIRQWMDHVGWYDLHTKEKTFIKKEDLVFISAMGPPGGGRATITQRLQRHFNIITYTNLGRDSIEMIFSKIVNKFLGSFQEEVSASVQKLVDSTQIVYQGVQTALRPTPNKSHYTFNLRDMSKIFQGVCAAHNKTVTTKVDLLRLWVHENQRVFGDRMISDSDKDTLLQLVLTQCEQNFSLSKDEIFENERIIFGDFFYGIDAENRPYQNITDLTKMVKKIEEYLDDYNSGSKHQMKLVMFLDACDHVARICRVLRQPQGNALLLGVGGSGRQSLSKLSTYMNSYKLYQIEVIKGYQMRDWKDNLKTVLMQAGVDGKPTAFLFVDTQIINEQMLEDINNVLNSGDVPALYKVEDMEAITLVGKNECTRRNITLNKMNMFQAYLNRVKSNIHLVLAMSPLSDVFRARLVKFPSLVNCCTIDWFTNWPSEALINVGKGSLLDADLNLGVDEDACIETFRVIHQSVEAKSEEFKDQLRRINYVTPTSFLELLAMYKKILSDKRNEVGKARRRLVRGLEVLDEAATEVDQLQTTMTAQRPILQQTQKEVEETKVTIAVETKKAEDVKAVVVVEEEEAAKQEAEVRAVKDDADEKLGEALPALEAAVKSVKLIDVKAFYDLQKVFTPGRSMIACFKIVCYFLININVKPKKPQEEKKQEYDPEGFWLLSQRELLNDPKRFKNQLIDFKRDEISEELVQKVSPLMEQEAMSEENVMKATKALVPVRGWIVAMLKYHTVLKIVNPMKEIARQMGEKLSIVQSALAAKQAQVKEINDKLAKLNAEKSALIAKAQALAEELEDCQKKLHRAEKMISGLGGEKVRWTETVSTLTEEETLLVGNCMIAAGMISYAGPFVASFREELEGMWRDKLTELGVKIQPGITMKKVLGNDVTFREWAVAGLPSDNLSIENGIIMFGSRRWPLMIDPQTQANKFIKNMGKDLPEGLDVFKLSENNLIRGLEMAITFGKWVLLENINEVLEPTLEPILLQQLTKQGSNYMIKLGERAITYNFSFKFFMTTTLPNPHYSPETSVKVTLLNFAITPVGLEEQMLNLLVLLEMPELQEKKNQIIEENAKSSRILYDGENKILAALDENTVMELLSTDDLINVLAESKKTSDEIKVRQAESAQTEKEIDVKREAFRPVAFRSSLLFFCIVDLNLIDPMYQYSLQWFQKLFASSVQLSQPEEDVEKRITILNDYFTMSLYQNVCRSLFERHKLLFSFLLTTKILFGQNEIDMAEWRFFLAGPSGQIDEKTNPTDWLDDLEWQQTYKQLFVMDSTLPVFKGITDYFINFNKKFKKIFDSPEAHEEPMPGEWNNKLNSFQKMILLKAIRPDKVTMAVQNYIIEKIGEKYVKPPTFRLDNCFKDSAAETPLVFVLSQGSDPVTSFMNFVNEMEMGSRKDMISLGQGQAKKAEKMINEARQRGWWVLLQNCHLSISWMDDLEAVVESFNDQDHPDFRLWMTSSPTPKFPVSILQNSVKMTMEPPTGLRSNLLQTYDAFTNAQLNDCKKPNEYKKLLFAFSFFHAIVQDRRKFGAIGWNIPYAFTYEDFDVCCKQLKIFLNEYEEIPFKVLNFLGAEINYGGRVTDSKDIRLINSILLRFIQPGILEEGFGLSDSGIYRSIQAGSKEDYIAYIDALPINPNPEAFGLHENAEITTNQNETRLLLENVISIQPRSSSGGGKTREQIIGEISQGIESKTPPPFDYDAVAEIYPTDYNESMNTVLTQELIRYNTLLVMMGEMLKNVQKALVGEVVMSEELEKMSVALFDNQVPSAWAEFGFLSLKPLASWIIDLNDRVDFLNKWIKGGPPATYWISGFFFPQAFFTGTLQNYARKHYIAIDELDFEFKMYDEILATEVTEKPEDGCFCFGMYLEGARWNSTTHYLDESKPKQLYTEVPLVWFLPKKNRKKPETGIYGCPVYKVLSRAGALSTTGHSTNYVLELELPSREVEEIWIRAGVAAFLSLRY